MDEVTHTLLEQPNGGFGGLGSGFIGGIIGGMLFGNGGYGFGGGANRGAIGYDTGAILLKTAMVKLGSSLNQPTIQALKYLIPHMYRLQIIGIMSFLTLMAKCLYM